MATMSTLEDRLKSAAHGLGFELAGIARATEADGFDRYCDWLDRGYAGEMAYLQQQAEARRHPKSVLEDVRSVVMLGMTYDGSTDGFPKVAQYAQGPDYHPHLWDRLNALSAWLAKEHPDARSRGVTDSAPLLERDFARRAGLGWFGKNTMLINPRRGSFFLLAALLTTLELQPDDPFATRHCGTCTACLDACPTQAFPEPGRLDARKCISYLTIELKGAIPEEQRAGLGDWLFGCDICQDVCPWNRPANRTHSPGLPSRPDLAAIDPLKLLAMSREEFRTTFRGTSLNRAKWHGLLRNAAIVLGNRGDRQALPALRAASEGDDPVIREAAIWAIARIESR
jgi:epoxyqueuosine reductase